MLLKSRVDLELNITPPGEQNKERDIMTKVMRVCLLALCTLIAASCQKRSGNIWDDNQTGAKYKHDNATAALWGSTTDGGPVEEEFIPLNDDDLKNQFADIATRSPSRELGDKGMPSAEQFETPRGELASIFSPVFFNTDEHTIKNKDHLSSLYRMAAYLKSHPKTYIIVEGHCDLRGPEAYNLALGTRRANYVRSLLLKEGVKGDQIHTVSLGKEHPFALGNNPEAWAQNRRAHFRVHTQGE
jgi:peptidoglycan-associated lipoprotein